MTSRVDLISQTYNIDMYAHDAFFLTFVATVCFFLSFECILFYKISMVWPGNFITKFINKYFIFSKYTKTE